MRHCAFAAGVVSLALASTAGVAEPAIAASSAPAGSADGSAAVIQAASPAAASATQVASIPSSAPVEFRIGLSLREPAAATALAREVADPASAGYGHYLTPAAWEARFSPAESSVQDVVSWLRSQGIAVAGVTPDRMTIDASAPAATIEKAFATSLGEFNVRGRVVRLTKGTLSVPGSIAPLISGVAGIDETLARPQGAASRDLPAASAKGTPKASGVSPAFVVGKPCSAYFGQKLATGVPAYGGGFPNPLPYAVCGYTPSQLEGAYGLTSLIAGGISGKGVTIAIVDALASPTLFADAHEYSERNQPGQLLAKGQFTELLDKPFEVSPQCVAEEEWSDEQHLDVEAVHATAPGAHILYVGSKTCSLASLESAVQQVVDGHLADIVTDSWGNEGELFEPEGARNAFDNVLLMADATGIGVQFSSGDEGDGFTVVGSNMASYPAVSPYATAVGGTALEVGKHNERLGELGWSTGRSLLCTELLEELGFPRCTSSRLETWLPPAPGEFLYGGGGGTSFVYPEPAYQEAVVPAALAERNLAITQARNRVIPDISMDGEPSTGFRVGETQEFPNGLRYNEDRIGGTSLSSPLFAGVMAIADQAAGKPLGFVNPLLYKLDSLPTTASEAFFDVAPEGKHAQVRIDYVNEISAREGTLTSVRVIEYEGRQEYCDVTESCSHEKNILSTAPGFDSMTGIGAPASGFVAALTGG